MYAAGKSITIAKLMIATTCKPREGGSVAAMISVPMTMSVSADAEGDSARVAMARHAVEAALVSASLQACPLAH